MLLMLIPFTCNTGQVEVSQAPQGEKSPEKKYSKYFFYDYEAPEITPEVEREREDAQQESESTLELTRLINMNPARLEGTPYMDFNWLWKGGSDEYAGSEHVHDFDEFIGLLGTKGPEDPRDLGGEIEFWLGGEQYKITESCLIYIPKGLKHCPLKFTRIDSPIFFFSGSFELGEYESIPTDAFTEANASERNYAKNFAYFVSPKEIPQKDDPAEEAGEERGSPIVSSGILSMNSIEGAPYIQFAWLYSGSEEKPTHPEHAHSWGEVFGYIGDVGQEDPYGPMGEVEFWIDGEKHVITKSCLVWMPADLPHCPVRFARIDKPILWFTLGIGMEGGEYDFSQPPADEIE